MHYVSVPHHCLQTSNLKFKFCLETSKIFSTLNPIFLIPTRKPTFSNLTPLIRMPCATLTNEAVAFVSPSRWLSHQHAGLDFSEGLKDALDVVVGEVWVDRRHVDSVEGSRFLRQLVNDWLSLANVAGPPNLQDCPDGKTELEAEGVLLSGRQTWTHLNVPASEDNRVHLLQSQLSRLGHLVLNEGETLQM